MKDLRNKTIKEIYNQEETTDYDTGLIRRWNRAINKPLNKLPVADIAMMIRQGHFYEVIIPLGIEKLKENPKAGYLYDGELIEAFAESKYLNDDYKNQIRTIIPILEAFDDFLSDDVDYDDAQDNKDFYIANLKKLKKQLSI